MTSYLHPYISKTDNSFSNEYLNHYIITIQYSLDGFCFVIYCIDNQKFISLEHYTLNDNNADFESILTEFLSLKNWNLSDFSKVIILFDNRLNTFIPASLFNSSCKDDYMKFLNMPCDNMVLSDYLPNTEAFNIYTVQNNISDKIKNLPANTKTYHASSILIESLIKDYLGHTPEARLFINVKNNYFELAALKNSILLFHNNFAFKTKEDFLYFLLFTIEQLHLDAETVPTYFMGLVNDKSKIIELCSRYIRDIRFIKRNNNLKYSKELDDIPYYYHYSLYSSISCEL